MKVVAQTTKGEYLVMMSQAEYEALQVLAGPPLDQGEETAAEPLDGDMKIAHIRHLSEYLMPEVIRSVEIIWRDEIYLVTTRAHGRIPVRFNALDFSRTEAEVAGEVVDQVVWKLGRMGIEVTSPRSSTDRAVRQAMLRYAGRVLMEVHSSGYEFFLYSPESGWYPWYNIGYDALDLAREPEIVADQVVSIVADRLLNQATPIIE